MSARLVPGHGDRVGRRDVPVCVFVDDDPVHGVEGQSIAGMLLCSGRQAWRHGVSGGGRGVFCGIGVCFDCLVTVNGERDVRACRRRAHDGDDVRTQSRVEDGR